MITVERYSKTGFKPQYQSNHLKYVDYVLNDFDALQIPRHLRHICSEKNRKDKDFYRKYHSDFQYGIWVFIEGYKYTQSLNHIKNLIPCWKGELPEDIEVYDVNWERKMNLSNSEVKAFGCYIPERELKYLQNIRRYKKDIIE